MTSFEVRQVGVSWKKSEKISEVVKEYRSISAPERITIDKDALELIAEELGIEAEGPVTEAFRFVEGKYRSKSVAFGGSTLGSFGEILSFLIARGRYDQVERVVGYERGDGEGQTRFPQPDFLTTSGEKVDVLEVKSTDAVSYLDLKLINLDKSTSHRQLGPCRNVPKLRAKALEQLGWAPDGQNYAHKLRRVKSAAIPFPASQGTAMGIIVHDGRVTQLLRTTVPGKAKSRYRTPPICREDYDCMTCMGIYGPRVDAVVVTMPNAPHLLNLPGRTEDGISWFNAYRDWSHAGWAKLPLHSARRREQLLQATNQWLERARVGPGQAEAIHGHWKRITEPIEQQRTDGRSEALGWDALLDRVKDFRATEQTDVSLSVEDEGGIGVSVRMSGGGLSATFLALQGNGGHSVINTDLKMRMEAIWSVLAPLPTAEVPMTQVTAEVLGDTIQLGWRYAQVDWWWNIWLRQRYARPPSFCVLPNGRGKITVGKVDT